MPEYDPKQPSPRGTRDLLLAEGAVKFSQWLRKHKPLMVTDTTLRDAHQSLFAARMRTYDMLTVADFYIPSSTKSLQFGDVGRCYLRHLYALSWRVTLRTIERLREHIPNILFQMLLRGSNGVGYANYPDNVVREFVIHSSEAGMDVFVYSILSIICQTLRWQWKQ